METNTSNLYDSVRNDFETSPFFNLLGFELSSITEDEVILELPVETKLLNTHGSLHGGVYATMIDNIISLKMRSLIGNPVITINLTINYVAPITSGKIIAKAFVYGEGKRTKMGEGVVMDENGKLLAKGSGTFKVIHPK
ncbi:PaaI family thioesterase [Pseudalkalibacillus hwajinpoensis]|uniref:PaaI family thioesterase n=1 Tax=Guptibacillus hwajinpoensis TaxID=208199 RepID=UPI001CFDCC52|nr:PaaI family thioesterase [Pseudalkalibacillus hwajinpoensis]